MNKQDVVSAWAELDGAYEKPQTGQQFRFISQFSSEAYKLRYLVFVMSEDRRITQTKRAKRRNRGRLRSLKAIA